MAHDITIDHVAMAQRNEELYGVPASVTLAQFILESGAGTSSLYKRSNNAFGITGTNDGNYVTANGRKFRAYSSLRESFDDHGKLLGSAMYTDVTNKATNLNEYIDGMTKIYAPASDGNAGYNIQLKKIISDYNLTQYDNVFWTDGSGGVSSGDSAGAVSGSVSSSDSSGIWTSILSTIIRAFAFLFLFVLAAVFFMNAFELPSISETAGKIVAKKVTKK